MVLHRQEVLKKAKKRAEFMQEVKEHRANSNLDKNEHKKMRLSDIQRQFQDKLKAIQSKQIEREQVKSSILTALSKFNSQKREIGLIKKQDQESNLMKHRRVQTAYKRLLVEKLSEKEERQKMLQLRKEKIKFY